MSILEVRDVSIIYSDDKRVAVEHASFKIEAGEYACIIAVSYTHLVLPDICHVLLPEGAEAL